MKAGENKSSAQYQNKKDNLGTTKKSENLWNEVTYIPGFGSICNAIFSVEEESIPTSFVIFPFKLKSVGNCSRTLISESNSALAMEYAKFISTSVTCNNLLTTLEWKCKQMENLQHEAESESHANENEIAVISDIYCDKVGHLYFLDEETGIPITKIVDETDVQYPILINNPIPVIKKLLPLMRKGMALMHRLNIVAVFAQVMAKSLIKTYPHSWMGAAQLIDQMLYTQPIGDLSSTRSITSLSQKADVCREDFLDFLSSISKNCVLDGTREGDDLDWTEELSILKNLMKTCNLSIAKVQHNLQMERIKVKVGGYVWVQRKLQNNSYNKTQDPNAKLNLGNCLSITSPHSNSEYCCKNLNRSLKKRYDVDKRIAAINEFLDMNDVEDSGLCGGKGHDTIDLSVLDISSSSNKTDCHLSSNGDTTETYPSTESSTSSTSLLERKKTVLRIRNAQLANYEIALSTLTASNNYLTISAVEEAVLKLKLQIEAYEKKVTDEDIACKETGNDLNDNKDTNIATLNRQIARKEAKIESMKKAVQQQEVGIFSERLEI